jgi:DNA-binding transcriptional MerR regulator
MTKIDNFSLLGDVVRTLGCKPYQITYLLTSGQLSEPARLGDRRLFTTKDIERIAAKLGIEQQKEKNER